MRPESGHRQNFVIDPMNVADGNRVSLPGNGNEGPRSAYLADGHAACEIENEHDAENDL
jgi:hypothetical protein